MADAEDGGPAGPVRPTGEAAAESVTEDALLGGRVRLLQPARGHRAGTDAVLLAAAAPVRPGERVADVGAATGAVGMMIAARVPAALVFVERQPALAELCRRNLALNGVEGTVVVADVLDPASRRAAALDPESADVVVTNPPFLEAGEARVSPDGGRAAAHVLRARGLEDWLRACAGLLKPRGCLALIHRADRLDRCLGALGRGFGGHRLRFVHPAADRPAIRVLMTAVKASRAPLAVLPPVLLHDASGRFTPEAERLHRGEAGLAGDFDPG
ncbi:MAG TPA: methyltransferase [Microvirga sp.]|nr:methyltransferase [Microvirga sp.]